MKVGLIFLCLALAGCEQRRPTEVREFPQGYRGWAIIVWGVPGHPELPKDHDKIIERFSTNGMIITSSTQQFGWAHDESYFVDAAGHRLPLRPNAPFETVSGIEQDGRKMDYSMVFVGTKAELQAAHIHPPQAEELFNRLYPAPNPQGGANGRQPPRSDTNPASAGAASRRSP